MTFTSIVEFCENAAGLFLGYFGAEIWELILLPVDELVREIDYFFPFFDMPEILYDAIRFVFGDTSIALACFSAVPLVVIILAVLGFLLGFIL